MVSPGTDIVKNHESLSIINESQFAFTVYVIRQINWRQLPTLFITVY